MSSMKTGALEEARRSAQWMHAPHRVSRACHPTKRYRPAGLPYALQLDLWQRRSRCADQNRAHLSVKHLRYRKTREGGAGSGADIYLAAIALPLTAPSERRPGAGTTKRTVFYMCDLTVEARTGMVLQQARSRPLCLRRGATTETRARRVIRHRAQLLLCEVFSCRLPLPLALPRRCRRPLGNWHAIS
ncbi:hypothetical protein BD626DRAFT_526162 [Schizophyllum amplum]|uniref:Uncharacterized protein n=1 Tax=Schizophyllum amplum TaxID=97359 RepID=A0A550BSD6_9AGAR|nr:hypothetical protein BD626DRAFT_526162 [Auriculariopsis ampla]